MQIGRNMAPMLVGLAVTQINTFNDSLIAWGLAAAPDGPQYISVAGRRGALSDAAGRRGRHLLRRPALRVPVGHGGHGRGRGHLSAC